MDTLLQTATSSEIVDQTEETDSSTVSKKEMLKKQSKTFWESSRGKIAIVWSFTLIIIAIIYLYIPRDDERALEAAFLVSTLLASCASTASILLRYASPDKFDWSAYLVHGCTFLFAFVMLGLLATDLAFTLRNRQHLDYENQREFNATMDILWQIVYWGNLFCGSFVNKFFQKYWVSGHFSVASRVKATLKQLLILMIAATVFLVILVGVAYYYMQERLIEVGKITILVASNVYGTLVLVILLSYGLAFLPFSIWKRANNSQLVFEKLSIAETTQAESKDARIEFMKEAKICHNFIAEHSNAENQTFMDQLEAEIPTEDLDGQKIYHSDIFKATVKPGQKIDETVVATRRFQLRHKMFIYRRKRAMWLSLHRSVLSKAEHPVKISSIYLNRKIDLADLKSDEPNKLIREAQLSIKVVQRHGCVRLGIRAAAFISVAWSVFLLFNETVLIFDNAGSAIGAVDEKARSRIWVIFLGAVFIMSATVFSAFLTIFKLKFSDYLQLVPKLTDPVTFCSFTSLFSKVIAVTCFNFMVMAGEVNLRIQFIKQQQDESVQAGSDPQVAFQTSFIKFYSSMIETPFLGDRYNYLLPGAILIFSICFLLLSYLKYESNFVTMLRRYNNHQDNISSSTSGDTDSTFESSRDAILNADPTESTHKESKLDKTPDSKAAKKKAQQLATAKSELLKIYKGELAFLKEVKVQRDKTERVKNGKTPWMNAKAIIEQRQRRQAANINILGGAFDKPRLLYESQEASLLSNQGRKNNSLQMSIEGSFEQRPELENWRLESLQRLQAMDLDPDFVDYGDDEDPFRSMGTSSLRTDQSFASSQKSIIEETKREPVYNEAGVDISEFMNQDFRKPVPFYRQKTTKTVARQSDAESSVTAFQRQQSIGMEFKMGRFTGSGSQASSTGKVDYATLVRSGTIKVPQRQSLLEEKQGYLEKKSSKSKFGISVWNKRYCVLSKGRLLMFKTEQDYLKSLNQCYMRIVPRKVIDLSHVTSVNFHYDRDAPVKSKKLFKLKNLQESRFDIYTPTRTFMLRAENNDINDSATWVAALQEALEFFS